MPVLILERMPLPSLRTYTTISVLFLACALYFANEIVLEASSKNSTNTQPVSGELGTDGVPPDLSNENISESHIQHNTSQEAYARQITEALMSEAWFVWVRIVDFTFSMSSLA